MRAIKFRAKAVVNDKHANIKVGDFVYGSYIESGCDAPCIIFGDGEQIEINKKTLGQYTSLTVNGVDFWEGDIISWGDDNREEITFDEEIQGFCTESSMLCKDTMSVIGDIHNNHDLLTQK